MTPRAVSGALLVAVFLAAGCGRPSADVRVIHDLVAEQPLAEVWSEPGRVDLGSLGARALMGVGWSWDEVSEDGTSFVWSDGESSALTLYMVTPRALPMRFRAFPFHWAEAPPQAVTVAVNGRPVAEVELPPGPAEHAVTLPAAALVAGGNRLAFRYRWSRSPEELGRGGDRRRLAVGWDWIRFGEDAGAPPPRAAAGRLRLPYGSQVDHFLGLPPGSALELAGVESEGGGAGRLEVLVRRMGGAEQRIGGLQAGARARRLALPPAGGGIVRLSLRAVGEGAGELVLERPAVVAPPVTSGVGPSTAAASSVPGPRPPIVLYLVDTLRADRLGCYGYAPPTSPHLDAFAAEATLFESAFAQSSWTKPAVASILTGLLPPAHGVNAPDDGLPPGVPLLAERLAGLGYATAAFVTNAHLNVESGFGRGFERFEWLPDEPADRAAVHHRALEWLDAAVAAQRAPFLYLHTLEPHAPYAPPREHRRRLAVGVVDPSVGSVEAIRALARGEVPAAAGRLADLSALYDAEVATADAAFGALLDGLEERGLYDEALVVFLSDHGEELLEHGGLGHGWDLYAEVLRVPLLIKLPGQRRGRRVERPVQHVDLVPTLLELLGEPPVPGLPGDDLFRLAGEPPPPALADRRGMHAYMDYEGRRGASGVFGPWHLIEPLSVGFGRRAELYELRADPGEESDLAAERPVLTGYLRRRVRAALAAGGEAPAPAVELDAETRRRLEAMGYL